MAQFFVSVRFWQGFERPFPFEQFDPVADDELSVALDDFAHATFASHATEIRLRWETMINGLKAQSTQRLGRSIASRALQVPPVRHFRFLPPTMGELGRCDGAPPILVCRVGSYIGWWHSGATIANEAPVSRSFVIANLGDNYELAKDIAEEIEAELEQTEPVFGPLRVTCRFRIESRDGRGARSTLGRMRRDRDGRSTDDLSKLVPAVVDVLEKRVAATVGAIAHCDALPGILDQLHGRLAVTKTEGKKNGRKANWEFCVAEYLKNHPRATSVEVCKATGCPEGSLRHLNCWKALKAELRKGRVPRGVVSFTDEMSSRVSRPSTDDPLDELVEETRTEADRKRELSKEIASQERDARSNKVLPNARH